MGSDCKFKPASDKAKKFIKDNLSVDAQNIIGQFCYPKTEPIVEYYDRARDNGITAMSLTASFDPQTWEMTTNFVNSTLAIIRDHPDRFMQVRTAADIRKAQDTGKLGISFHTQGSENLAGRADRIAVEKSLGFVHHLMGYNLRYPVGDGCYMQEHNGGTGGLTKYGKDVIDACVRNKVIVDFSHSSIPLALQGAKHMKENHKGVPFIYSHSNPKASCDYLRNLTDEQIKTCAESGGSIGLCFFSIMFTPDGYGPITMDQAVGAIDYVKNLVGIDHIHISSDDCHDNRILDNWGVGNVDSGTGATGEDLYPDGGWVNERCKFALEKGIPTDVWEPAKTWPALLDALWAKGYSDEECAKIFGGNIMRIYEQVL